MNMELDEYLLFEKQNIDHYVQYFLNGDSKLMEKHMKKMTIRNLHFYFDKKSDPIVVNLNGETNDNYLKFRYGF